MKIKNMITTFNEWRANYDNLTDKEQKYFYEQLAQMYPTQKCFTPSNYNLLARMPNARVLEVGGWKGELFDYCNEKFSIHKWVNVEFCLSAAYAHARVENYFVFVPERFRWFNESILSEEYDVAIASHVIEHLSDKDFGGLLTCLQAVPVIIFEAPISDDGQSWDNYLGTHKLKLGWKKITKMLVDMGYECEKVNDMCRVYRRVK